MGVVSGVAGCDQTLTDSFSEAFGAATNASSASTACEVAKASPVHTTPAVQGGGLRGRRRLTGVSPTISLADVSLTISSIFASADKAKAATATINGQGFAATFDKELAKVDSSLAAKATISSIAAVHKDTTTAGSTTSAAPSNSTTATTATIAATTATEVTLLSRSSSSTIQFCHAATALVIVL